MSFCTSAIDAASSAVSTPTIATTSRMIGACEHGVPPNHVHAGRHHRGGVDQRRHRGRAFHGIRQPDVERNLGALGGGAHEKEEANQGECPELQLDGHRRRLFGHHPEVKTPEGHQDQEHPEDEAKVANAIGEERLLAGVRRALLLIPETDEQVGTEPHPFPSHEHHQEVAPQDEHEHEEAEQVQVAEEARVAAPRFVVQVRGGVDVDEKADSRDDEDHHA